MIPKIIQKPVEFAKVHKETIDQVKEGSKAAGEAKRAASDGFDAVKDVAKHGMKGAKAQASRRLSEEVSNPTGRLNLVGKLKVVGSVGGALYGLAKIPGNVGTAVKDIREAARSGSSADATQAARSSIDATRGVVETTQRGLQAAVTVNRLATTYRAANAAFKAVVPSASKAVASAAGRAAMKATFEGAAKSAVKGAAIEAAKLASGSVAQGVVGSAGRAAATAALREGGQAAGEAALRASARAAQGTLAKSAARLAPALNVALAVLDTANAIVTLRDPKASSGAKICSVITAAGSIVAATNIPIVSQGGAVVSAVSGVAGAFF